MVDSDPLSLNGKQSPLAPRLAPSDQGSGRTAPNLSGDSPGTRSGIPDRGDFQKMENWWFVLLIFMSKSLSKQASKQDGEI